MNSAVLHDKITQISFTCGTHTHRGFVGKSWTFASWLNCQSVDVEASQIVSFFMSVLQFETLCKSYRLLGSDLRITGPAPSTWTFRDFLYLVLCAESCYLFSFNDPYHNSAGSKGQTRSFSCTWNLLTKNPWVNSRRKACLSLNTKTISSRSRVDQVIYIFDHLVWSDQICESSLVCIHVCAFIRRVDQAVCVFRRVVPSEFVKRVCTHSVKCSDRMCGSCFISASLIDSAWFISDWFRYSLDRPAWERKYAKCEFEDLDFKVVPPSIRYIDVKIVRQNFRSEGCIRLHLIHGFQSVPSDISDSSKNNLLSYSWIFSQEQQGSRSRGRTSFDWDSWISKFVHQSKSVHQGSRSRGRTTSHWDP